MVRLYFEESDKSRAPSKLSHKLKTIPERELLAQIHKEIREDEQDNIGVEATHKTEQGAESVANRVQSGYHGHKLKPYRKLAKVEKATAQKERILITLIYIVHYKSRHKRIKLLSEA